MQESLSNAHRHSHNSTANILLVRQGSSLNLGIANQGRGIPPAKDNIGVGIAGIRERVRLLKGTMTIITNSSGTVIKITLLPREEKVSASGAVA